MNPQENPCLGLSHGPTRLIDPDSPLQLDVWGAGLPVFIANLNHITVKTASAHDYRFISELANLCARENRALRGSRSWFARVDGHHGKFDR
jgi:hypothetical protein